MSYTPHDSWSKVYDQVYETSFGEMYEDLTQATLDFIKANYPSGSRILDIGAGTGLAAEALTSHGIRPIDALDISQEMLSVAALKGVYRNLMVKDITIPFELGSNLYSGLISSGTFTTGHVGPEALDHLLAIALPGALFALSINAFHWKTQGFESKFSALDGQIYNFKLVDVAIYGGRNTSSHKDDNGRIALFKKQ